MPLYPKLVTQLLQAGVQRDRPLGLSSLWLMPTKLFLVLF